MSDFLSTIVRSSGRLEAGRITPPFRPTFLPQLAGSIDHASPSPVWRSGVRSADEPTRTGRAVRNPNASEPDPLFPDKAIDDSASTGTPSRGDVPRSSADDASVRSERSSTRPEETRRAESEEADERVGRTGRRERFDLEDSDSISESPGQTSDRPTLDHSRDLEAAPSNPPVERISSTSRQPEESGDTRSRSGEEKARDGGVSGRESSGSSPPSEEVHAPAGPVKPPETEGSSGDGPGDDDSSSGSGRSFEAVVQISGTSPSTEETSSSGRADPGPASEVLSEDSSPGARSDREELPPPLIMPARESVSPPSMPERRRSETETSASGSAVEVNIGTVELRRASETAQEREQPQAQARVEPRGFDRYAARRRYQR